MIKISEDDYRRAMAEDLTMPTDAELYATYGPTLGYLGCGRLDCTCIDCRACGETIGGTEVITCPAGACGSEDCTCCLQ